MESNPNTVRLLEQVAQRLKLAAIGRTTFIATCVAGVAYAAVFVVSRGLGLLPDFFHPVTILAIPAIGLLLGLLLHRRPERLQAARRIDQSATTRDLYLTVVQIASSGGGYQALVLEDAERRAEQIDPRKVVPLAWEHRSMVAGGVLAALLLAVVLVPQFDPFGSVAAAAAVDQVKDTIEKTQTETRARMAELKKDDPTEEGPSAEVDKMLEHLVGDLDRMRRDTPERNAESLAERQKEIAGKWRDLRNSDELRELLNKSSDRQSFGRDTEMMRKWSEALEHGDPEPLNDELNKIKDDLQRLARTEDPIKRQELQQQINKALDRLDDFAKEKVKSPQLRAALNRAMEQMKSGELDPQVAQQALEAAMESVELAKQELEQIAQSAEDLEALEEALATIQKARKLNSEGELDGMNSEEGSTMADYAEFYEQLMAGMGQNVEGDGEGTGGDSGTGRGGVVDENEDQQTGYQNEKSRSAIDAGKVLLTLKTKGISEAGDVKQDYQRLVDEVQRGISEAIELEEIPPGYVPGIKSYFNTLDGDAPAGGPSQDAPAAE